MYYTSKEFKFEASHKLCSYVGKCHRNHGHNYKVIVTVAREDLCGNGISIDFGNLKKIVNKEIVDRYDHRYLNECSPFDLADKMETEEDEKKLNDLYEKYGDKYDCVKDDEMPQAHENTMFYNTTAENMSRIFFDILKGKVKGLYSITIYETDDSYVTYKPSKNEVKK